MANTAGDVQERYAYEAYGQQAFLTAMFVSRSASSYGWETLYAAYQLDAYGLFLIRNRIFTPLIGSWAQWDPLGLLHATSCYEYASGNSIGHTDPFGLAPKDKKFGLPDEFWNWYHRQVKRPGDPDISSREEAMELYNDWINKGRPDAEGKTSKPDRKGKSRGDGKSSGAKAKSKGGSGKKGGLLGKLFICECEIGCIASFRECNGSAHDRHETCLNGALSFADKNIREEQIAICNRIVNFDLAECATKYTACGLTCLVPLDLFGAGA